MLGKVNLYANLFIWINWPKCMKITTLSVRKMPLSFVANAHVHIVFFLPLLIFASKLWITKLPYIHTTSPAIKPMSATGYYDATARRVRSRKNRKVINAIYSSSIL